MTLRGKELPSNEDAGSPPRFPVCLGFPQSTHFSSLLTLKKQATPTVDFLQLKFSPMEIRLYSNSSQKDAVECHPMLRPVVKDLRKYWIFSKAS